MYISQHKPQLLYVNRNENVKKKEKRFSSSGDFNLKRREKVSSVVEKVLKEEYILITIKFDKQSELIVEEYPDRKTV